MSRPLQALGLELLEPIFAKMLLGRSERVMVGFIDSHEIVVEVVASSNNVCKVSNLETWSIIGLM